MPRPIGNGRPHDRDISRTRTYRQTQGYDKNEKPSNYNSCVQVCTCTWLQTHVCQDGLVVCVIKHGVQVPSCTTRVSAKMAGKNCTTKNALPLQNRIKCFETDSQVQRSLSPSTSHLLVFMSRCTDFIGS